MADVTVTPATFTMVFYDADHIAALVGEVADRIGLDVPIRVEVDESTILGRVRLTSMDPVTIAAGGGALEDPKRMRHLSEASVQDVAGRMLMRARDRLDPSFGSPPSEEELTLQQSTAWNAYAMGRLERLGYQPSRARWQYHFRNRHGFTDVADGAFNFLWGADGLAWADIEAVCERTVAARLPAA